MEYITGNAFFQAQKKPDALFSRKSGLQMLKQR
jgi:hypothetical protein